MYCHEGNHNHCSDVLRHGFFTGGKQMRTNIVRETTLSGLFIAIGIILPMLFHALGQGATFLPMHIPVLLAGFILSLPFAVAVGIITPILSSILTSMPPIFPVLPFMVFELATYGLVTSFLYRKLKLNVYVSLVGAMLSGRIVATIVVWVLINFFFATLPSPIIWVTAAVTAGLPGIVIQLALIPVLVLALNRLNYIRRDA